MQLAKERQKFVSLLTQKHQEASAELETVVKVNYLSHVRKNVLARLYKDVIIIDLHETE